MDGSRKVKIIAIGTASVVHLIGFATPAWAFVEFLNIHETYHYGLWQNCTHEIFSTAECSKLREEEPAWLISVQILESLGLLGLLISIIISAVLKCFKQSVTLNHKTVAIINVLIIIATGICIIVGVAMFGTNDFVISINDDERNPHGILGYSFFLCTAAGGFLLLIYTPILLYDLCRRVTPQKLPTLNTNCKQNNEKSNFNINPICQRHSTADLAVCQRHSSADLAVCQRHSTADFAVCQRHSSADLAVCQRHSTADLAICQRHSTADLDVYQKHPTADFTVCQRHSSADFTVCERHSSADLAVCKRHSSADLAVCPKHSNAELDVCQTPSTSEIESNDYISMRTVL